MDRDPSLDRTDVIKDGPVVGSVDVDETFGLGVGFCSFQTISKLHRSGLGVEYKAHNRNDRGLIVM